MQVIAELLGSLLRMCCGLLNSYAPGIVLFTLLTKIILFPVSLWTQRNGIKMVELMPALNRLKIRYYGDKDTIAEETQKLYKERGYHPLTGTVPMLVQLLLLIGVIAAVQALLGNSDSILSVLPSERGGVTLLMPLAAGLSALLLGLAQNRLNPLQREQSRGSQWATNALSIAVSLLLGAFVPLGVGLYWISSNLFTILQQLVLNKLMPPEKYVDYAELAESKKELAELDSLKSTVSAEDRKREKEDYKRFFSVDNKHLVFYAENSGFYKYFQNVIEYILKHSNVIIHYITSDPGDQIFRIAKNEPRIRAYYIGEKRLITLFMKMDAQIVVMTMPDLNTYHIKRSYVKKDIEYVYIFHGLFTGLRTLRPGALDHFDSLLTVNVQLDEEIRRWDRENNITGHKLIPCGYSVVDNLAAEYEHLKDQTVKQQGRPKALIAPSWQPGNIVESSCLRPLCETLLARGYDITLRPHPQYSKRFPANFAKAQEECAGLDPERFRWESDYTAGKSVYLSDLLVTDWSGIGYEYALGTKKPVLFINTPKKIVNPQCEEWYKDELGFDMKIRELLGAALAPEEVSTKIEAVLRQLEEKRELYSREIERIRTEELYHFGESGKYGAQYLLNQLRKRK